MTFLARPRRPGETDQPHAPAHRRGLLDARPANDTTLVAVTLPPSSATAPRAPAPIAPRVGPVRRDFRQPWVRTFEPPTCGECGERPALVTVEWPPHYATVERDGKRFPACEPCAREDRQLFVKAKPAQLVARAAARRLDERVLEAVTRRSGSTVVELCIELDLLPEDAERSRENRPVVTRVDDALRRLRTSGRVSKRRAAGAVRFYPAR